MRCLAFVLVAAVLAAPAQAATLFTVELDGAQEVPPTGSTGTGVGSLTLENTGGGIMLSYVVEFDDTHDFGPVLGGAFCNIDGVQQDPGGITGSDVSRLHVHNAARGANGPVV